jgi:hypothetical protein
VGGPLLDLARWNLTQFTALYFERVKGDYAMANNKNPGEKLPGEKPEGKFHYNPGNMSGKKASEEASEKKKNDDKLQSRDELPKE